METSSDVPDWVVQLHAVRVVVKDCMLQELVITDSEAVERVREWMEAVSRQRLLRHMGPSSIVSIASVIREEIVIREFVLSMHERLALSLSSGSSTFYEDAAKTIEKIRDMYSGSKLLDERDASSLAFSSVPTNTPTKKEGLKELLQSDPWLTSLYLCIATNAFIDAFSEFKLFNENKEQ